MANFYTPSKKRIVPQLLQVEIDSIDAFGQGIAYDKGKTIFIPQALPGERVDIRLFEEKKQYAKGQVVKRYNQSTSRVTPLCPHFGVCGGCQLQHASPEQVQQSKLASLCHLMTRESGADLTDTKTEIVAASPYHYRRRARLALRFIKHQLLMGFRRETSNDIIDVKVCPVLVPELEALIVPLRDCLNQLSIKRELGHVELIAVDSGLLVVLRHLQPLPESDKARLIQFGLTHQSTVYLQGHSLVCLHTERMPYYRLDDLTLTFSPLDFIQVNGLVNQKMVAKALSWLALTNDDQVLDLFCGMGNFSLPIAKTAKQVVGVEGVHTLVEKAKMNTELNNKTQTTHPLNALFYQENLDDISPNTLWLSQANIDKVLLDPARQGALNVMAKLVEINSSHLVYISCNPATLARDSKILIEAGYKIDKLAVLDMFPQTKHIESMVRFIK
ncbi:23S rRNA (uracil(1939)-C(5))-methyltransferase RlmD [Utexia brackfieldae]|uniref:23S rRNA (uracil(1939)-C(5))-methyltransferase RlmD n=1 Tax=Utexia brackfieldae TaxID=3074108 RepID=UPI00370DC0FF